MTAKGSRQPTFAHTCTTEGPCNCNVGQVPLEPREDCPAHGHGLGRPRCTVCGRYMKMGWQLTDE